MMKSVIFAVCAALAIGAGATTASANGGKGNDKLFCKDGVCATTFKKHCWDETVPVREYKMIPFEKCWEDCVKETRKYKVQTEQGVKLIPYSTCKPTKKCETFYKKKWFTAKKTKTRCVTLPHCEDTGETFINGSWKRNSDDIDRKFESEYGRDGWGKDRHGKRDRWDDEHGYGDRMSYKGEPKPEPKPVAETKPEGPEVVYTASVIPSAASAYTAAVAVEAVTVPATTVTTETTVIETAPTVAYVSSDDAVDYSEIEVLYEAPVEESYVEGAQEVWLPQ